MDSNINKSDLSEIELAAGFPPFTRGYKAFNFETKTVVSSPKDTFDFELNEQSEDAILNLFTSVLPKNTSKKQFKLFINTPINNDLVCTIRAIRTLLALVNEYQKKEASFSSFLFYIKSQKLQKLLIEYHFVKASQIDFFVLSEKAYAVLENFSDTKLPIDPFYGNININQTTNRLIKNVWKKIQPIL